MHYFIHQIVLRVLDSWVRIFSELENAEIYETLENASTELLAFLMQLGIIKKKIINNKWIIVRLSNSQLY